MILLFFFAEGSFWMTQKLPKKWFKIWTQNFSKPGGRFFLRKTSLKLNFSIFFWQPMKQCFLLLPPMINPLSYYLDTEVGAGGVLLLGKIFQSQELAPKMLRQDLKVPIFFGFLVFRDFPPPLYNLFEAFPAQLASLFCCFSIFWVVFLFILCLFGAPSILLFGEMTVSALR